MTKNKGKYGVMEFIYFPGGPSDSSLCLTAIKLGLALRDAMSFFFLNSSLASFKLPHIHKQYPEGQTPLTVTLCDPPIVYWNPLCFAPSLGSGRWQSAFVQDGVPTSPILTVSTLSTHHPLDPPPSLPCVVQGQTPRTLSCLPVPEPSSPSPGYPNLLSDSC